MSDREQLERAVAAQENLRGVVDDDVIDLTISSLRDRIAALEDAENRRRHATVLFADVLGFTSLAEGLNTEVVSDVMNDLWSRLDETITAFGGRIDKHIGDAVMGLWGSDSSHENDPEQAVRAALALQAAVAAFNTEAGRSLAMRVGISTGQLVFGAVATTREFTAMGDTVNIASRLEQSAPAGGVVISHDTYRHVRGVFDVTPLEPIHAKGKAEPLRAYAVLRAKPQTFRMATRGVEGVETRMVGRDDEFAVVTAAFEDVGRHGDLRLVLIVGEAGVGKSRLLYEFENWVELLPQPVYFLKARATPTRQSVPYGVFRDMFAARFAIRDSDSPMVVVEKLRAGFEPHLDAAEADLVGHWLGFDLSAADAVRRLQGSEAFASVCRAHLGHFLTSLASTHLTLIEIEDLHWADSDSVQLLGQLLAQLRNSPTLIIAATRPTIEPWPELVPHADFARTLTLEPLGEHTARALVRDVLQHVPQLPAEIVDLIVDRADGNPFFVEELIKMLIDDAVIIPDIAGSPWRVDLDRLQTTSIPSTLTGVLEARLDSLTESHRTALQRASVVGRVFWDAAVGALDPSRPASDSTTALTIACDRELIYRRDHPTLAVGTEYIFKHALLRDVAYETVLLRDRKHLHALAAAWLSVNAGERLSEYAEMIAEHLALAGDRASAADLYLQAGERARQSARSSSSRRALERAFALWEEAGIEPPAAARVALAHACCRMGDFDDAERVIAPVIASPASMDDEASALYFCSWVAEERGQISVQRDLLDRALPLAESLGGWILSRVLLSRSWLATVEGDDDRGTSIAQRALDLANEARSPSEQGRALGMLARLAAERGDFDVALERFEQSLELSRTIGDIELEAMALANLGVTFHLRGEATGARADFEAADRYYRDQLVINARIGAETHWTEANLAQVSLRLGALAEGRARFVTALRDELEGGTTSAVRLCLLIEAELQLLDGDEALGLMLIGAVATDPETLDTDRREVDRLIARLHLSDDAVHRGRRAGAGQNLLQLAADTLDRYSRG